MNKLSFNEIVELMDSELFKRYELRPCDFLYDDKCDYEKYKQSSYFQKECGDELAKLGSFECVEHYGGEGQGDVSYSIYHFKDHDVYIHFDGWYTSHEGSEYSDCFEVEPYQVTVTQYKPV